jgi:nicotinate phosphoribosyltransferase
MSASRAAYIGGAAATSNSLAGRRYGIPVFGTMAHSWIMSFPDERAAFDAYADLYPDRTVFLIDTYDTLQQGIVNAIAVGRRLQAAGKKFGVRLDSGDIHYLSMEVRKALDAAGLTEATISVSNDLDESIVATLTAAGAPIDSWGVGTQMVTGGGEGAFTGVYKLAARSLPEGGLEPVMKFSDNPDKTTSPGVKQVYRLFGPNGQAIADVLASAAPGDADAVEAGPGGARFWHPSGDYRHFRWDGSGRAEAMLAPRLRAGELVEAHPKLEELRRRVRAGLDCLDPSYRRQLNPHLYKVAMTEHLRELKLDLIKRHFGEPG